MGSILIGLVLTYKYFILFPFAVIEGTSAALVSGFFASLGNLSFFLAYLTLLLGDLIPDAILYQVGKYSKENDFLKRFGSRIGITANVERTLKHLWYNHTIKSFLFSKLALWTAIPLLISAGFIKYPFKKFMSFCLAVSGVRILVIMLIGFSLGSTYKKAIVYIDYFYIFVGIAFVILMAFYFLFTNKMRGKFKELEKESEAE